jgi:DNA-directed RNA polymerase subunit RPC12/RpoP
MDFSLEGRDQFAANWDYYMILITGFFAITTLVIFSIHEIRVIMIKDFKEKYDYVTLYEIKNFWFTMISGIIAATFLSNTFMTHWIVSKGWKWFAGRTFLTICLAILTYVLLTSLIRIYYPRYMERRLNRLRNKPRTSPAGNLMRKLSESEEDAHLEADQIAQEGSEVHSVDYDVWIDEKTGYKKIEKYHSYQHAIECPECGYVTMKIHHEEVSTAPTQTESGLLTKHYRCTFCSHRERKEVPLAKLADNVA